MESLACNCCCGIVYVVFVVAKKTSVVASANKEKQRSVGSIPSELALSFFLIGLNRFAILTVGDRLSRHWRRGDCVRPSRSVVVVARARVPFFVCFFLGARCCALGGWRAVDGVCALLDAVCATRCCVRLARCCVRGSTLCALCAARRCVRLALCSAFFVSHSETRMYFFALQIAAYSCWLVVVTAQVMNAADADALNQTLTGLGCWQSQTCQTKNFSCSSTAPVRCNANGSVTYL